MLSSDNIEVVRKANVFKEQISEAEQAIIEQRVQLKQQQVPKKIFFTLSSAFLLNAGKQFAEFQRRSQERKILRILSLYEYLSREEVQHTLAECNEDEDMSILKFTEPDYLPQLRKIIAQTYRTVVGSRRFIKVKRGGGGGKKTIFSTLNRRVGRVGARRV